MNNNSSIIAKTAELLKSCKSIFFITGAGISADSGLPTYRGIGGLYNDKLTEDGIPVELALAGETLEKQPAVTWKYLSQIEKNCRSAKFNRGHEVIAEMEKHFERVCVLTQNIDGFHHAAGSRNIIDIHGDMHKLSCTGCGWRRVVKDYSLIDIPPRCPDCAGIVRPEVVFFGEMLPEDKLVVLDRELMREFDIYFSIGTTSVFPYIRQPMITANYLGRPTVEINPENTEISGVVGIKLRMRAAEALDAIWKKYLNPLKALYLSEVVTTEIKPMLYSITKKNRERAVSINVNPAPCHSQQEALKKVVKIGKKLLPEGYRVVFPGGSQAFQESNQSLIFAMILGIFVAYMVLTTQFNSFLHPCTVLLALPFSVSGAFPALLLTRNSLN